jgi:hypothetical protein
MFALCALLVLMPPSRTSAARAQGPKASATVTPCDLNAYVIDQDPNGLNVTPSQSRGKS